MRTTRLVSSIGLTLLLLLTLSCSKQKDILVKHATNTDEDAVKLHGKIHELRSSIDQLMGEFASGRVTDVASKVSKLQYQAKRLEDQSDTFRSEVRMLAGEIVGDDGQK
jgi:hypothetical protein